MDGSPSECPFYTLYDFDPNPQNFSIPTSNTAPLTTPYTNSGYATVGDYVPAYASPASSIALSEGNMSESAFSVASPPTNSDHYNAHLSRTESMSPSGPTTRSPRGRPRQESDFDENMTEQQRVARAKRDYARTYRERQRQKAEEAERLNQELQKKRTELEREIVEKRQALEELNRAREEMETWKMRYVETSNRAYAQMLRITQLEQSNEEYRRQFGDMHVSEPLFEPAHWNGHSRSAPP